MELIWNRADNLVQFFAVHVHGHKESSPLKQPDQGVHVNIAKTYMLNLMTLQKITVPLSLELYLMHYILWFTTSHTL